MYKKILMTTIFLSQCIYSSQAEIIELIDLNDIPQTVSYEPSEVNNDSFCVSVISYRNESGLNDTQSKEGDNGNNK